VTALLKTPMVAQDATVAVVSPASTPQSERIESALTALRALGFAPLAAENMLVRGPLYFAGSPELRLDDLHTAFADEEIRAIFATRGGYGSNYLLDGLELGLIADNPKPFFGYSDLTALQLFLLDQIQLPVFHGPMLSADFSREDGVHLPSLRAALAGQSYTVGAAEGMRVLHTGEAKGVLYGGCLSIMASLLGTSYEPQTEGKLLFLEDVNAKPYQIDRMLWQMREAGKFEGITGIVFGEMLECNQPGGSATLLEEVILHFFEEFDGPIAIGLRSGHVSRGNVTLTMGVKAELNVGKETRLRMVEAAVAR